MAKAKDLAGLAALAGLAYAMRNKDDSSTTDTGDETNRLASRYTPPGSVVDRPTQSTISGSQVNPDANLGEPSNPDYGNENIRPVTPTVSTPVAKAKTSQMTAAQNNQLAKANQTKSKVNPRLDQGGRSASLAEIERRIAARDEDARLGNIKAAKDYNRGREMESQVLNNMITNPPMKKGGVVKKMAKGGMTSTASSASKRADGIASKGKTKCKMY